ncbi:hypothetical protein E3N88_21063 [Mikania micrantha]|uniref:Retroviral polymerase SH3-like domain-containing protein n=1 Tax=Mikania micrantha TaxID=192012 RepID=A0A5N6NKE9_9ASTR|nr:hypothetical protein E3N88_21063 [Mikania micrantha]
MRMPQWLWGEGVRHAIYLLNRIPTKAAEGKTPYEPLKGRKPKVDHLKLFGCTAHAKAYRLYNPQTNKIVVSRDVQFQEDKPWDWSSELQKDNKVEWAEFEVESESSIDNTAGPACETVEPDSPPLNSPNEAAGSLSTPASSNSTSDHAGPSHYSQNDHEMMPNSPEFEWNSPMTDQYFPEQNSPTLSDPNSIPRSTYDDSPIRDLTRDINRDITKDMKSLLTPIPLIHLLPNIPPQTKAEERLRKMMFVIEIERRCRRQTRKVGTWKVTHYEIEILNAKKNGSNVGVWVERWRRLAAPPRVFLLFEF